MTAFTRRGLIDQARSQLWTLVNEFVRRPAPRPARPAAGRALRVRQQPLPAGAGYVRQVVPFTDRPRPRVRGALRPDHQRGRRVLRHVIQAALDELRLEPVAGATSRSIFIAGNEPFTQGPVDFRRRAAGAPLAKGIVVNTIHCGPRAEGEQTGLEGRARVWPTAPSARSTRTRWSSTSTRPQDAEIARLGVELNKTYIPYGAAGPRRPDAAGGAGRERQGSAPGSATQPRGHEGQPTLLERGLGPGRRREEAAGGPGDGEGRGPAGETAGALARAEAQAVRRRPGAGAASGCRREINRAQRRAQQHVVAGSGAKTGKARPSTLDVAMTEALREQAACRGIELQ